MLNKNNEKSSINEILPELQIEKYPMAESPNLIEYFLIVGYEESYIQQKIIKNFNSKMLSELEEEELKDKKVKNVFNLYKCRNLPTILSSISSNFSSPMEQETSIIQKVFPIPPSIVYTTKNNSSYEPFVKNVIFTNIQNIVVQIGYAFIFYENRIIFNKSKIFIPKAFVIISQYPFFNTFRKICNELLFHQFKNKLVQIPIEIQLYNIINFIPAPVNEELIITFFPSNELSNITNRCNSDNDLIGLNNQQVYKLNQLSGYRQSEIDMSVIFFILPVDIIIQAYLQLLTGHTIAFFSKDISILNTTMYIFQQFFYPLNHDESTRCVSPIRYFCAEFLTQNILGFLCSYDEVNDYNPFREVRTDEYKCLSEDEEKENLDYMLFGCDFVLDLDKNLKTLIYVDNNKGIENYEKYKKEIFKILELTKEAIVHKENQGSDLECSIKNLSLKLKEISFKLTFSKNKDGSQNIPNYFTDENKYNHKIQEAFYEFNLEISYQYFQSISTYNGNYLLNKDEKIKELKSIKESGLNKKDYLFFSLFSETFYCNILNIFVGGYSKEEPVLYKTPRIIFENFIYFKKLFSDSNDKFKDNYLDLIDEIYISKEKMKEKKKIITFLNFYKYYNDYLVSSISSLVRNEYVELKINKNIRDHIKYFYEYKTIDLDKNLLMEYIYIIESKIKEENNKLFDFGNNNYSLYKPINKFITTRIISNLFENYLINMKYIECIDILIFSILNILALSIRNMTLIPYVLIIYNLFQNLNISSRKYIEIILSISLRLLIKEKNPNYLAYEKYFNLYQLCIEANGIFPNDQLIYLKKKIDEFKSKLNDIYEDYNNIRFKKIEGVEIKKLYSLQSKVSPKKIIPIIESLNSNNKIKNRINFKSKYYKNKEIKFEEIYCPKEIFMITNNMLDKYYQDLDFKKIDDIEYEKIIIYLIYYVQLFENKLPKDINKFLFYCLEL